LSIGIRIVDGVFEHVTMSQSSHLLTGKDVLANDVALIFLALSSELSKAINRIMLLWSKHEILIQT